MAKIYKVRTHTWEKGILHTKDHVFTDRQQAINFGQYAGCDHAKVLDNDNRVIYQQKNYHKETAAKTVKVRGCAEETYA